MSGALLNQAVCAALYRPLKGEGTKKEGNEIVDKEGKSEEGGERRGSGDEKKVMAEEERRLVETIAKLEDANPSSKHLNVAIIATPEDVDR